MFKFKIYIFSIIITLLVSCNKSNNLKESFIDSSLIDVDIGVGMVTQKESYTVEDNEIILNIINKSIYRKLYSIGEYLEKFQDNKWYYVGNNSFFDVAAILPPNKINDYKVDINRFKYFKTMKLGEEGINISKLTPGKYRILKSFYFEEEKRDIYLSAEFNVE